VSEKKKVVVSLTLIYVIFSQCGWFGIGIAVTAFVTQTNVSYIEPGSSGIGDDLRWSPGIYLGHSGPLSLVVLPWVGAMSTGHGFSHLWEETAPLKLLR